MLFFRYQSCYGIMRDFEIIREFWKEGKQATMFPIAKHDMEDKFVLGEERLYGREKEIAELNGFLESFCTTSESGLVLVGGHPGVGKSSLIRNIFSSLASQQFVQVSLVIGQTAGRGALY